MARRFEQQTLLARVKSDGLCQAQALLHDLRLNELILKLAPLVLEVQLSPLGVLPVLPVLSTLMSTLQEVVDERGAGSALPGTPRVPAKRCPPA